MNYVSDPQMAPNLVPEIFEVIFISLCSFFPFQHLKSRNEWSFCLATETESGSCHKYSTHNVFIREKTLNTWET